MDEAFTRNLVNPPNGPAHAVVCAECQDAPKQNLGNGTPAQSEVARRLEQGEALRAHGDYHGSIAEFNAALHLDATDAEVFLRRGQAFADRGDHEEAVADFTQAVRLDFNLVLRSLNRVLTRTPNSRFDEAVLDASESVRISQ